MVNPAEATVTQVMEVLFALIKSNGGTMRISADMLSPRKGEHVLTWHNDMATGDLILTATIVDSETVTT